MAAAIEESSVSYEELMDLEREFDDAETETLRHQVALSRPLYEKRSAMVAQIPNFWPLVFEQAPPDIDEYIQPTDSSLLLTALTSLTVSRFEVEGDGAVAGGDPRSLAIRFEFADNEHFADRVLEKRFWHRHSADGWSGLVSEPVDIHWKEGKDLTGGLLGLVRRVWEEERRRKDGDGGKPDELTPVQEALKNKIEGMGLGGLSFFAWFGFRGPSVSAEESARVVAEERERRKLRAEGKEVVEPEKSGEEDEEEEEEDLEIYPDGENLAITIAEDLWPGALKYFLQAQEQDSASDDDFESDEDQDPDDDDQPDGSPNRRPNKRRKE